MGLKFSGANDAKKYVDRYVKQQEAKIIRRLHFAGQRFVVFARSKERLDGFKSNNPLVFKQKYSSPGGGIDENTQGFHDRTGNLRASIGYIIVHNGKVVDSDVGNSDAWTYANKLKANVPIDSYAIICVAGMDYASYVEAKGYDVITGGSIVLTRDLKRLFK